MIFGVNAYESCLKTRELRLRYFLHLLYLALVLP